MCLSVIIDFKIRQDYPLTILLFQLSYILIFMVIFRILTFYIWLYIILKLSFLSFMWSACGLLRIKGYIIKLLLLLCKSRIKYETSMIGV